MKTIFLVEDDPVTMRLYQYNFRNCGARLCSYDCAEAAMSALNEERPALFLVDLDLPGASGMHLLCHVREHRELSQTPVLMITAQDMPAVREALYQAGATAVIPKPFSPAALSQQVKALLA